MLAIVAGLYVIEGFPMGVFRLLLPAWWVEAGMSTASIGVASGFGLAWSIKALWSPLVQWRGDFRLWISGALLVMAAALFALPSTDPSSAALMWIAVGAFCLASATQDIAIDAATIGIVPRGDEGPANAMRVSAYRLAMAVFGTGALFLPGYLGWEGTLRAVALVPLAMAAAVWLTPPARAAGDRLPEIRKAFASWRARPGLWAVAGFLILFRLSDFGLGPMLIKFQYEAGLSREEVGILSGLVGGIALVVGASLGGALVHARGIGSALLWTGILAVASNLLYASAALPGMGIAAVYTASAVESVTGGMVTAAFMSFLMRICEREWAAVQYATLTAIYPLVGQLLGMGSGFATEALGFAGYFALTALFTLPAFAFLPTVQRWLDDAEADATEPSD
jgi:PAT family beta-lactamase induction signal transducer AmpG